MSLDLTDWQNKKYTTRSGRPVRILCIDAKDEKPILGLITNSDGYDDLFEWYSNGKRSTVKEPNHMDLINAKTKREGWVNLYKASDSSDKYWCSVVRTRIDALDMRERNCIATIRIEWEE